MTRLKIVDLTVSPHTVSVAATPRMPSKAAISLRVIDDAGLPAPAQNVSFYVDKGYFLAGDEPLGPKVLSVVTDDQGHASTVFTCSVPGLPGLDATPGEASFVVLIGDQKQPADLLPFRVKVIGRPAFVSLTGAPANVVAGEAVTILATVKDAINQEVADQTEVKFTATPEGRLTDEVTHTISGVATTYLLTSNRVEGIYSIVAVSGGITALVQIRTRLTGTSQRGG